MLRQAGAIPYRRRDGDVEFLLVTSKGGNWIFPKGIVEPGESEEEAALKECREEAGVGGRVAGVVGTYLARKWTKECRVRLYLVEFQRELDWEEADIRERRWATYGEASTLIKKQELRRLLREAVDSIE